MKDFHLPTRPGDRESISLLPELPVELWLCIAEFLEPKERTKLLGVNRLFFELAMDELYQRLSLVSDDVWLFVDTMEILSNPLVASRVRYVTIWPVATWAAMSNPKPEQTRWLRAPRGSASAEEGEGGRGSWWRRPFSRQHSHSKSSILSTPVPLPSAPSEAARMRLFTEALANLTRVEELHVYVKGVHEKRVNLSDCLTHCLKKVWPAFKTTLRRVTIDTPTCLLDSVFPLAEDLPVAVQSVELLLRQSTNIVRETSACPPQKELANFVQQIGQIETLKAFRICPDLPQGHNFDLWNSLLEVKPMATLASLSIESIGPTPTADPKRTDLHHWILRHQGLQELSLSFEYYSTAHPTISIPSITASEETVPNTLPNVTSLTLHFDRSPNTYQAYLEWISSFAPNVTSLRLKNIKRLSDLNFLLDRFAGPINPSGLRLLPKLKALELGTDVLGPSLIDTLVTRCPNLTKLKLDVQVIATREGLTTNALNARVSMSDLVAYPNVRAREEAQVIKMIQENGGKGLDSERYKTWKLEDLSILQWVYGQGRQYNWEIMSTLARVVPSIQSFVERGHMRQAGLKELEPKYEVVGFGRRSDAWS